MAPFFFLECVTETVIVDNNPDIKGAMKRTITVIWRYINPLTVTPWMQRLEQAYAAEQVTAILQMKMDTFARIWNCVTLHSGV